MGLPRLQHSKYPFTVPSTGEVVYFRPYTVGEEKILLTTLESEDVGAIIRVLKDVILACSFGAVNPDLLTTYDLDLFFLNLRSKSSGESLNITLLNQTCKLKEGAGPCEKPTKIPVNLAEIKVMVKQGEEYVPYVATNKKNYQIPLAENMGVVMRHPTIDEMVIVKLLNEQTQQHPASVADAAYELMTRCLVSVYEKDNVYSAKDFTLEEKQAFFNDLERPVVLKVVEFFNSIPSVRHTCKFKCDHCDFEKDYEIEGTADFFD